MSPNFGKTSAKLKQKPRKNSIPDRLPPSKAHPDHKTSIEKSLLQKLTFNNLFKSSNKKSPTTTSSPPHHPPSSSPLSLPCNTSAATPPTPDLGSISNLPSTSTSTSTSASISSLQLEPQPNVTSFPNTLSQQNELSSSGKSVFSSPLIPTSSLPSLPSSPQDLQLTHDTNLPNLTLEFPAFAHSHVQIAKSTSDPTSANRFLSFDSIFDINSSFTTNANAHNRSPSQPPITPHTSESLKKSNSLKYTSSDPNFSTYLSKKPSNLDLNNLSFEAPFLLSLDLSNSPALTIYNSYEATYSQPKSVSVSQTPYHSDSYPNPQSSNLNLKTQHSNKPIMQNKSLGALNRSFTIQQISSPSSGESPDLIMVKNSKGVLKTLNHNDTSYFEYNPSSNQNALTLQPQSRSQSKLPSLQSSLPSNSATQQINNPASNTSSINCGPSKFSLPQNSTPASNQAPRTSSTSGTNPAHHYHFASMLQDRTPQDVLEHIDSSIPMASIDLQNSTKSSSDFSHPEDIRSLNNYSLNPSSQSNPPIGSSDSSSGILLNKDAQSTNYASWSTSSHTTSFPGVSSISDLPNANQLSPLPSTSLKPKTKHKSKYKPIPEITAVNAATTTPSTAAGSNTTLAVAANNSSYPPQKSNKSSQAMRLHSSQELMFTEKSFAENLYIVKKMWMEPVFASANASKPIIPYQAARIIFFQFDELHAHALQFYTELKNELSKCEAGSLAGSPDLSFLRIGALFKSPNRAWQIFVSYVENYSTAMHLLNQLNDYKPFTKYQETLISSKKTARQSLKDLLMLPIQRVMRYSLLLKTILKHTPIDFPDHLELCRAVKTVTQLAVVVNSARRRQEESQHTIDVLRTIENCPTLPLSPENKFLFDVAIQELVSRLATRFYIFSDYLIVTRLSPNSKLASNSSNSTFPAASSIANQISNSGSNSNSTSYSTITSGNSLGSILNNSNADSKENWVFYSYAPLNQIELQNADEHADTLVTVLALNRYKPQKGFYRRSQSVTNLADALKEKLPKTKSPQDNQLNSGPSSDLKNSGVNPSTGLPGTSILAGKKPTALASSSTTSESNSLSADRMGGKNSLMALAHGSATDATGVYGSKLSVELLSIQESAIRNSRTSNSANRNRDNSFGNASTSSSAGNQHYPSLGSSTVAMELMQSFIPPPPLRTHVVVLQHYSSESRRNFVKMLKQAQREYTDREKRHHEHSDTYSSLSSQIANGFSNEKFLEEKLRNQSLFNTKLERQLSVLRIGEPENSSESSEGEYSDSEYTSSDGVGAGDEAGDEGGNTNEYDDTEGSDSDSLRDRAVINNIDASSSKTTV